MTAVAQQPGLRSFIIYDRLPEGCVAFQVTDKRSLPHIRPGEYVVVDTNDRDPINGELFLIQWQSGPQVPHVMETFIVPKYDFWAIGHVRPDPMMTLAGEPVETPGVRWCDWPYREEQVRERSLGRVIGIYEPATLAMEAA